MSENNLGRDVKALRTKRGIGSRELSRLVGKAETYISQLERGLIKTPDYNTAFEIMKHLGQTEDQIEDFLLNFYLIKSPERIEAEEAWDKQEEENAQDPDYQQNLLESQIERYAQEMEWLDNKEKEMHKKNEEIKDALTFFIGRNPDTFFDVIEHFNTMVKSMKKNEEDYQFFTKLFKRDITKFSEEGKKRIIETIAEEYQKSFGGWGEPPRF
jgi:transcriptional regulator with XRE-family HTH domain